MAELNDPEFHALKVRAKIHAMGTTYLCHPANRVKRINRAPVAVLPYVRIHDEFVFAPWAAPELADRVTSEFVRNAIGIDPGAGDDAIAVTFVTPGKGLTASLRMNDDRTASVIFPKSQFSSDEIAKRMIADALGLFRAPGFNPRRNQE